MITAEYESRGVRFEVRGDGRLLVDAPRGELTDDDKRRLRERKAEIVQEVRLIELRREYVEINALVKQDGRVVVRSGVVEIPCIFLDQVIKFRVHDAGLRVDGYEGCIQEAGRCPTADPVKCLDCDRRHRFVALDDCRCEPNSTWAEL